MTTPSSPLAQAPSLQTPTADLVGVGPTRAKQLADVGVCTLGDLLEYFPFRYQIERSECPIQELVGDQVQYARGEVIAVNYSPFPRKRFEATLEDPTGTLSLAWFNGAHMRGRIHPGEIVRVQGKVNFFRALPQMVQPSWEIIAPDTPLVGDDLVRSVYPATAKIKSMAIWKIMDANLAKGLALVPEWFEQSLLSRRMLLPRRDAYRAIHRPASEREAQLARRRLVYDELMLMQLALLLGKRLQTGDILAPEMKADRLLDERIRKRFPFELTQAQTHAVWEILRDMKLRAPMNRLLQGDVGSGKTVVALYAMLVAVANGFQSLILAPTEILAEQHKLTIGQMLHGSNVRVELVTHDAKKAGGADLKRDLANGKVHIAIGTQALLGEDVNFQRVGLVVVDEQHKLGVRQRGVLREKGLSPHYLIMTATPIPRTLALSYFADFAITTIRDLPPGRQPIKTHWFRQNESAMAYTLLKREVALGRQAFVVVPKVEEGGDVDLKSVQSHMEDLHAGVLSGLRVQMLHGQMKPEQKQQVMDQMRTGQIDVLVATTVVEVGVDVPNATVMLIENAEMFGLAQLHQLRGRVGRGRHASFCLLVGDPMNDSSRERLEAMVKLTSGFDIADVDLQLRGPGEFFGLRQHGLPQFKLADIAGELEMLQLTRQDATQLLERDPQLLSAGHRVLRDQLQRQFGDSLYLVPIR